MSVLAILLQPGAVDFVVPALLRSGAGPGHGSATLITDPAWVSEKDRAELAGCEILAAATCVDRAAALLAERRPAMLVVSTTRNPIEIEAMATAASLGIQIVQILDVPYNHVGRVRESSPPEIVADAIAVISERDKHDATVGGIPPERIAIVGHPGWERIPSAPPADPTAMVFVSQPADADGFGRFGYSEKPAWSMVLEARRRRPDLFRSLIWAPHPRETVPDTFPDECDGIAGTTRDALLECGTVLGIFSAALTNAYLMGRRVVSVQPGKPADDFCGLSRAGWIARCGSVAEIVTALEAPVRDDTGPLLAELEGSAVRLAALLGLGVQG